ncbi:hypothetical protein OG936_11665 [Streptomyces sp. NBC_00846]|nr:hypothetical protein OG936_11665 [Streptomyces sp. NBC_00846]
MSERKSVPAFESFTATDGGIAVAETTTNHTLTIHALTTRAGG